MSKAKYHHYVPASYQKQFRKAGTTELYRLKLKTGVCERSNPDNTLGQKHLYRMDNPPPNFDNIYIETPLLSTLDERFVNAIRSINQDIQSIDKNTIAICIAFLKNRTPVNIREFGQQASEDMLDKIYNCIVTDTTKTEEAKRIGFDLTSFDSFKISLQGITLSAGKDYSLQLFLLSSSYLAAMFFEKQWTLLTSKSKPFITSDKPVTAVEEYDEDTGDITQYYLIPLSCKYCIKSHFFDGGLESLEVDDDIVDEINVAIAHCAEEMIVGPDNQQLEQVYAALINV